MTDEVQALRRLSAELGNNSELVQAGGGNTSLKTGNTMWIKASGRYMRNALREDIFVPVRIDAIGEFMARGEDYTAPVNGLRPSVESSMHAVLPQRVVVHVHSVRALSWVIQSDAQGQLDKLLHGLRWAWIPYVHPGVPLALAIEQAVHENEPDVLLLQNHGLIVCGDSCDETRALLNEVEQRLNRRRRPVIAPVADTLDDSEYQRVPTQYLHDPTTAAHAAGGTLYPDHCVYLGHAAAHGESVAEAAAAYRAAFDTPPSVVLTPAGAAVRRDISPAGLEMLQCLDDVLSFVPDEARLTYLPLAQVARLMNWEAEKYRQAVSRTETQ